MLEVTASKFQNESAAAACPVWNYRTFILEDSTQDLTAFWDGRSSS